ncbi:MAG: coproporphyrinogen dehydrogenase HemZ [Lachnospiraceae bacterium]|nr:coproporphyrinogen dehydrogenase HemZ [Lachnospiraceae bacterium]
MINISLKSEFYSYDAFHIVKAFFPSEDIKRKIDNEQTVLVTIVTPDNTVININQDIEFEKREKKQKKHFINKKIYKELKKCTGIELEWGILTGIRPTKIVMKELEKGYRTEQVIAWLQDYYEVSDKKAKLSVDIALREQEILKTLDYKDGYSLYVGIPFCPTTCSYCSFTSYPIAIWKDRVNEYMDAMLKEITYVGNKSRHKKLNSIYVGGGTPTTLEPYQLERLLTHIESTFSYDNVKEITVEAGRPDSITREKLEVLRKHNISRISINPQSMQQKTLQKIGRRHTVEDIIKVFHMARELGFTNINMDLIVGLPGETIDDVYDTLAQVEQLMPDSLTVHCLAVKRAARMSQADVEDNPAQMSQMIELASQYAQKMNLVPYYLYRQKNMTGNFENVGYAKVDKIGIYNILIMEEKQSIVAVGAGASTKIVLPREKDNIIRIENVKDIDLYITKIDEMIERKGEWLWL